MKRNLNTEDSIVLTGEVIGCALEVHRYLGPGMLESTYEQCFAHELKQAGIDFRLQVPTPVHYKGVHLDCAYKIDLLVEDTLVVELKAVERVSKVHEAQLLTYMKHAGASVGLIINFSEKLLKDGIRRFII